MDSSWQPNRELNWADRAQGRQWFLIISLGPGQAAQMTRGIEFRDLNDKFKHIMARWSGSSQSKQTTTPRRIFWSNERQDAWFNERTWWKILFICSSVLISLCVSSPWCSSRKSSFRHLGGIRGHRFISNYKGYSIVPVVSSTSSYG